ncbi:hypothetical protein GCK72_018341 [Caenorhabditis remanei]|uniref:Uncharacterized protein n=1 Tax=Caenorhabditis remanei TaxID=31234 RepID=A0A6A5G9J7_CAERE|nr:hypothetical protein GCK72_018341 [Caenorhabditis remanei]KAF1751787.1 hypothetical protein GCK72_018341 [Caenorhabditis remanei]
MVDSEDGAVNILLLNLAEVISFSCEWSWFLVTDNNVVGSGDLLLEGLEGLSDGFLGVLKEKPPPPPPPADGNKKAVATDKPRNKNYQMERIYLALSPNKKEKKREMRCHVEASWSIFYTAVMA